MSCGNKAIFVSHYLRMPCMEIERAPIERIEDSVRRQKEDAVEDGKKKKEIQTADGQLSYPFFYSSWRSERKGR